MIQKDYTKLELDKVLELVSREAYSDDCREQILALSPERDMEKVRLEMKKTDDAFILSAKFGTPRFSKIKNVKESVRRCQAGSKLSLRELLDVGKILRQTAMLLDWHDQSRSMETSLSAYFESLCPNRFLEQKITNSILSEEELSDNASPELAMIRKRILRQSGHIREQLDRIIKNQSTQKYLQESLVTMRDGRFVVPVKSEHKGDVSGLVHDTSASGSTLFIEPMAVVEANNEIRVLKGKELVEIDRIIKEMSENVAEFGDAIIQNYDMLIELEIRFVKANFGAKNKCMAPIISDSPLIILKNARHPLIDKDFVVPISLSLGESFSCLIVTGPNTGGKTVAIKTAGLFVLMAYCGLLLPAADGTAIGSFSEIYADIGDEQSIEQSLSTFSSHITNIVSILEKADENALVLLDELGSGTDPVEGSALAVSILTALKSRGCRVLATTHYQEVKIFALQTDGVENASCEFDVATLKPTYRLVVGLPGKSNAFAISTRLGIPETVIGFAKELVSDEDRRFEDIIEKLEAEKLEAEKLKNSLFEEKRKAEQLRKELETEHEKIEQEKESEIAKARARAQMIIEEIKAQSNIMINELEEIRKEKDNESFSSRVGAAKSGMKRKLDKLYDTANPVEERKTESYSLPRALIIGDTVKLADIDKKGSVISLPDSSGNLLVQVGIMKTKTNVSNLRLVAEEKQKPKDGKVSKKLTSTMNRKASMELDIRGMNADEGVMELDRFIDNSLLSGIGIITIIHGKGTGILREAVHRHLRSHKNVESFRIGAYGEGDSGVTVAQLKS